MRMPYSGIDRISAEYICDGPDENGERLLLKIKAHCRERKSRKIEIADNEYRIESIHVLRRPECRQKMRQSHLKIMHRKTRSEII